eukprot:8787722-Alexandrium_andersonii.AAC.1
MSASLVGSEMCIRDSANTARAPRPERYARALAPLALLVGGDRRATSDLCLLYTSDAADDM